MGVATEDRALSSLCFLLRVAWQPAHRKHTLELRADILRKRGRESFHTEFLVLAGTNKSDHDDRYRRNRQPDRGVANVTRHVRAQLQLLQLFRSGLRHANDYLS